MFQWRIFWPTSSLSSWERLLIIFNLVLSPMDWAQCQWFRACPRVEMLSMKARGERWWNNQKAAQRTFLLWLLEVVWKKLVVLRKRMWVSLPCCLFIYVSSSGFKFHINLGPDPLIFYCFQNLGKGKKGRNSDKELLDKPDEVIHVRARRGQATDNHSIAERVCLYCFSHKFHFQNPWKKKKKGISHLEWEFYFKGKHYVSKN